MKSRILAEACLNMGLVVWLLAATLLPFMLALGGAGWGALVFYVLLAGWLFAAGDAVLGLYCMRNLRQISQTGLIKAAGLALPCAVLFALGTWLAPTAQAVDSEVCKMGGFAAAPVQKGKGLRDLDPNADCLPRSAKA